MTRVQKAALTIGTLLIVSGPFFAEPLIFTLREFLVSTGISSDFSRGFCGAVWALTCSIYAIFGTMLFGLALVFSTLVWWLIEKSRVKKIGRSKKWR